MILTALAVLVLSDQPIATAGRAQGHVQAPSVAAEPVAPSITGARAMSTDEQIAAWIGASPGVQMDRGEGPLDYDAPFEPERRIRGEVSAAIGSHGYQAFGVGVSIPIGESGLISLHYSESEGRFGGYSPYGYGPYSDHRYDGYGIHSRSRLGAGEPWNVWGDDELTSRALRTRGVTAIPDAQRWSTQRDR
ncbi:MAG: hypothetical protein ACK4FB_12725 [Brevundimonas sp.]|uniref:hypothetical protein n=1 Tax=Brevundimonas sp. TaxID=1871086 RepID=UPI00391A70EA